jgi:hypothetical protein
VEFRKNDNAFLWVADRQALQVAADGLSAQIIRKRLDYWTWVVGPKFSAKDRQAINLGRHYSLGPRPRRSAPPGPRVMVPAHPDRSFRSILITHSVRS